jgi:SAM-dependent methyltransferase
MTHLFTGAEQAAFYSRFRPTYPPRLFERVYAYAAAHGTGARDCAADVACGTGQAASELAKAFTRVVALDPSPAQLANAVQAPNVAYALGTAEATGLPSASVDLLVVAEAMHWFDVPAFYAEAARVLRPRGTIAIIGYSAARVPSNPAATQAHDDLFFRDLAPYWDARRALIDGLYAGLEPPGALFEAVQRQDDADLALAQSWPVEGLVGNAASWSGYTTFMKKEGIAPGSDADPLPAFRARLLAACGVDDPLAPGTLEVRWPAVLMLGTKKVA